MDLLLIVLLLLLSAVFSGSETAYFSLRPSERARLAGQSGAGGRRVARLLERPHALLSAILIGNLLVNTALSVVATAYCLRRFGQAGLAIAVPAVTIVVLVAGEVTPKMLALRFRRAVALATQRPLAVWLALVRPVLALILEGLERLLHHLPLERTGSRALNVAELETACDLAVEEGALTETEGRFLARLLQLGDLEVRQAMTPRPQVVTLEADWTRERILQETARHPFNRYPVVQPDQAQPVGFFHLKDLIGREAERWPLREGLRPLPFVPESKSVAALLGEMRTGAAHLAAVVDEHGDFIGIVTLSDCLHALIGPAGDERRAPDMEVFRVDRDVWVCGGRLDQRELNEATGVLLPPSPDYVTLAGFVMQRLGRIPRPGDAFVREGTRFAVLEMKEHKVVRVQVERLSEVPGEATR